MQYFAALAIYANFAINHQKKGISQEKCTEL